MRRVALLFRARQRLHGRLADEVGFTGESQREAMARFAGPSQKARGSIMEGESELYETKRQARQRARTPEAILESEEWLFTTLQSIGDAVIATDAHGFVVFMNPVAVQLTGWSEEMALGKDCREVFHIVNETTRRETESPVTRVLRDGVISGLANHTLWISRDGTERSIDDSGAPIGRHPQSCGYISKACAP